MNKLQVIATEGPKRGTTQVRSKVGERRLSAQGRMDRRWKQKDPRARSVISRWREDEAVRLAGGGERMVDLGCGAGHLVARLGCEGVELSQKAIALAREIYGELPIKHDYVPYTQLEEDIYDVVFALDLIGEMDEREYRLFFSELYRLVKPEGKVIFSSAVDIDSLDAKERLLAMAEKDFVIEEVVEGCFGWAVRLMRWFPKSKAWIKQQRWLHRGDLSHIVVRGRRRGLGR